MGHGRVNETVKRRRLRLIGEAIGSGGLSLVLPRRSSDPLISAITMEEHSVLLNALEDYAEWAADASNDKRNEAERADPPDEGLDAEADQYDNDRATAIALLARLSRKGT